MMSLVQMSKDVYLSITGEEYQEDNALVVAPEVLLERINMMISCINVKERDLPDIRHACNLVTWYPLVPGDRPLKKKTNPLVSCDQKKKAKKE